jgi:hypothetical protein
MSDKINKLQRLVLDVIRENPGCQNDDARLIAAVWRKQGWTDGVCLEDNIAYVTRPESITRRRRELHEMGLITYSKDADESRRDAFVKEVEVHSDYIPAMSWLND